MRPRALEGMIRDVISQILVTLSRHDEDVHIGGGVHGAIEPENIFVAHSNSISTSTTDSTSSSRGVTIVLRDYGLSRALSADSY